jgi:hypothetical protein
MYLNNLAAIAGVMLGLLVSPAAGNGQVQPGTPTGGGMGQEAPKGIEGNGRDLLQLGEQTAQQKLSSEIESLLPSLGLNDGRYDWLRRIELNWDFLSTSKPEQSILTVQPLYQSKDKKDTLFVQGSVFHYAMFGDYRWTGNIGTGYRRLLLHDSLMLGVNSFFDNEFTNNHRRMSVGGEVKWGPLDFHANEYIGLTEDRAVDGDIERVQSGREFTLATQVPFVPWVKVSGNYFWWDKVRATNDTKGTSFAVELALLPSLTFKYMHADFDLNNNASRPQDEFLISFQLAKWGDKPTLLTGPIVSDRIFATRDLREQTLAKVVRENRIIVERRTNVNGATVIISRLN